jgi:hypothetical protein
VIITHLFDGGTILATKKTSYADILRADHLEQVVEDLMKEQHRNMLRRLRKGEFDPIIERLAAGPAAEPREPVVKPQPSPPAAAVARVVPPTPVAPPPAPPVAAAAAKAAASPAPAVSPTIAHPLPAPADLADRVLEQSLDDIILSYLLGEDKSG